ncbi:hypothetical protein GUJ93_ZPchr0006g43407 [Zizania palustris]|uniref:Uncharacterized protein n=1 Tax=Zizania palustris TaxID=103762 RepID=A0A8J5SH23_ZIZPA|nr:hypothetical protein GUJ93_ZPchr0006g43407 [Zizania palustris]
MGGRADGLRGSDGMSSGDVSGVTSVLTRVVRGPAELRRSTIFSTSSPPTHLPIYAIASPKLMPLDQ